MQNEVNNLKEKQKSIEQSTKQKIKKIEFENMIKYKNLKKKMFECLKETKNDISKLKIEYLDVNGRLAVLQNYQLLSDLEYQSLENKDLINENKNLKKKVYDLEKELDLHKKVEIKLEAKIKKLKYLNSNKNNIQSHSLNDNDEINKKNNSYSQIIKNISNNNSINYNIKDKLIKIMNEDNSYKNINTSTIYSKNQTDRKKSNNIKMNKRLINLKNSEMNYNNSYFGKGSISTNYFFPNSKIKKSQIFPEEKYNIFDKYIKNKKEENEQLKYINDTLKQRLFNYESKYNGLFLFLEECLEKFFKDVDELMQQKTMKNIIYIDIEKIKKFDFSIFNDNEKYNLLILIMNYLLPLVTINFNSKCNLKKNFFKTNLNIIDRNFNKNKSYLNDRYLRKAFLDKNSKLKADLFFDMSNNFSNSIPILRKSNSNFDSIK